MGRSLSPRRLAGSLALPTALNKLGHTWKVDMGGPTQDDFKGREHVSRATCSTTNDRLGAYTNSNRRSAECVILMLLAVETLTEESCVQQKSPTTNEQKNDQASTHSHTIHAHNAKENYLKSDHHVRPPNIVQRRARVPAEFARHCSLSTVLSSWHRGQASAVASSETDIRPGCTPCDPAGNGHVRRVPEHLTCHVLLW
jgi:hypothetical protein